MSEHDFYWITLWAFLVLPGIVFVVLFFVSAPYGRFVREGWGPKIDASTGWVVMEAVSPAMVALCFVLGFERVTGPTAVFFALWQLHYLHRAFVYPLRRRGGAARMPVLIVASAVFFNAVNGYLNGRYLFHFGPVYDATWFGDPRFFVGVALFLGGWLMNLHADEVLRNLRRPGETGYKIPYGGLYRWVSSPNYLGEIIAWTGFAIACWSPPGLVFAVWTFANLAPRALANHRWYRDRFPEYPAERRALVPFVF